MKDVPIPTPSGLSASDPLLKKWLVAARAPFFSACVMPVAVTLAACWRADGSLRLWQAVLTLLGIVLIHAGANMANDYFDHRSGADPGNRQSTPFSGGSRVIQDGVLAPRAVLAGAAACSVAGIGCGLVLWLASRGHLLLAIGVVGMALAWEYTGPPLRLAHRGIGEVAVGVSFGILPALGTEWVQRGALTLGVSWVGVPAGLLVAAILVINEFPDAAADAAAGKRTLVVRLGMRGAVAAYELLVLGAYAAVGVGIAAGWLPPLAAVVLAVAPLSWRAVRVLRAHCTDVRAMLPAMTATIAQQALFLLLLTGALLADSALHAP